MIKRFLEWLEDKRDIRAARKSIKEGGSISWENLRKELSLEKEI